MTNPPRNGMPDLTNDLSLDADHALGDDLTQASEDLGGKPSPKRFVLFLYALTIFASAFLLFQVQPLIAKLLLPWFGGAAAVWTTCLLFFQVGLLLGYLYAHGLIRYVGERWQTRIHLALLTVSLLLLPILPGPAWKPAGPGEPALRVLLLLTVTVGVPFWLLASTSPLLQAWYARERPQADPYRFYALSNAGSLLALLSYPVLVEPLFSTHGQAIGWSIAYAAACIAAAGVALLRRPALEAERSAQTAESPSWTVRWLWLALPACSTALLLAVTNHLSQNVAAVPLLWVIPLSLYLLSFILCFERRGWYRRSLFLRLLAVMLGAMAYALQSALATLSLIVLIPLFCLGLFVACMVCHGELARLKPHPSQLTSFYLLVSLGGALGGIFVAVIAPHIFPGYFELHVALGACAVLVLAALHRDPESPFYRARRQPAWLTVVAIAVLLNYALFVSIREQVAEARVMVRNFYGVLREIDIDGPRAAASKAGTPNPAEAQLARRQLLNGTIQHGLEFLAPDRRDLPTAYYGPRSGAGLALSVATEHGPLRVGVIGLGVGTLAAYGRPGDHYTFYEINPQVIELAERDFYFLHDSAARIQIVPGDARLSLEREGPQNFDVLAVDAFSGDAIPVHLLTVEAFELYFHHLKPGGVLAVHISNSYLDLRPVVARAAAWLHKPAVLIVNEDDQANGIYRSSWVLIAGNPDFFAAPEIKSLARRLPSATHMRLWTDDYSNLFAILKWTMR
jgi:hypothetical protein